MPMRICRRCSEDVPDVDFPLAEKLGGFDPWCEDCLLEYRTLTGEDYREAHTDWKRDRMWAYMKARRAAKGVTQRLQYRVSSREWTARLFIQQRPESVLVRIRCKWELGKTIRDELLVKHLGADPIDVVIAGRGGGRGYREQPLAEMRTEMTREQWDKALVELNKELTVQEVRA